MKNANEKNVAGANQRPSKLCQLVAKFSPKMMKLNSDEHMKNILLAHSAEMSEADLTYLLHMIDEPQCQTMTPDGRAM